MPVALSADAACVNQNQFGGQYLLHFDEWGHGRKEDPDSEVFTQRRWAKCKPELALRGQGGNLTGESDVSFLDREEKRTLACAITRQ